MVGKESSSFAVHSDVRCAHLYLNMLFLQQEFGASNSERFCGIIWNKIDTHILRHAVSTQYRIKYSLFIYQSIWNRPEMIN